MMKAAGAFLILVAASVYGIQLRLRLAEHLRQMVGFKEMLLMLSGEMAYARTPLGEAFSHMAKQGKEPFGQLLSEVSCRMEQEHDKTLYEIWSSAAEHHRKAFFFSREEFQILTSVGENFGYLDVEMQLNHLALSMQQVEHRIVQIQSELAVRQKMYQYLSVMGGLFLILILL